MCDPCQAAYAQARADERKRASDRKVSVDPPSVPAPSVSWTSQTVSDLTAARDVLMLHIKGDPDLLVPPASASALPGLVRELREVRRQLDSAAQEDQQPASEEAVDEFTAAREARAARKAGA